jgi:hypothetical protein
MNSGIIQNNNEREKENNNNYEKKIEMKEDMDKDEEEYDSINNNGNNRYNHLRFSSISIKSNVEELNFNKNNISSEKKRKGNKKSSRKKQIPISNNKNINDNQKIFDFTNKLYNSDEHLTNNNLFKRKNSSQKHLPNINLLVNSDKTNKKKYLDKKSVNEDNLKVKRKSLFHEVKNKNEEEKGIAFKKISPNIIARRHKIVGTTIKKITHTIISKNNSCANSVKKKSKINNLDAFLKLKEKEKNPRKVYYIDTIINNTINSKINAVFHRNTNKDQTIKSIKTIKSVKTFKSLNKNVSLTPESKDKNNSLIKIEDNVDNLNKIQIHTKAQTKTETETEKKDKLIQKIKCIPFHFLCCLESKFN